MTGRVPERYTQNPRGNVEQILEAKDCTSKRTEKIAKNPRTFHKST